MLLIHLVIIHVCDQSVTIYTYCRRSQTAPSMCTIEYVLDFKFSSKPLPKLLLRHTLMSAPLLHTSHIPGGLMLNRLAYLDLADADSYVHDSLFLLIVNLFFFWCLSAQLIPSLNAWLC